MDRGGKSDKTKGAHILNTQTLKHSQTKSQKHSAKKTNQNKKYNKACITIPTEDNTDEEKRGC